MLSFILNFKQLLLIIYIFNNQYVTLTKANNVLVNVKKKKKRRATH